MKKILALALVALLMLCALSFTVSAEDGTVVYIKYGANKANDGLTADTPKPNFGAVDGEGVVGLLAANGGTLVVVGKGYIGNTYTLPALGGALTITSVYGGVDYKNPEPAANPACAFKMFTGASMTISSDVTFDNIILFQEGVQNTLVVPAGVTLTVTDTVVFMTKEGNDYHWKVQVAEGGTAILSQTAQETFTIENLGGKVLTYGEAVPAETTAAPAETTAAPVETTAAPVVTTAAPVVTTAAPVVTTAAPVETTAAPVVTTAAPVVTTAAPVVTTVAPAVTTAAPVETTAAPVETTAAPVETTAAPVETTAAPVVTTAAPTAPAEEAGAPVGLIVGIVAAVVVVAAIAFVVLKKKK